MKKQILLALMPLLLLALAAVTTTGCKGCTNEATKIDDPVVSLYHDYDGVIKDFTVGVDKIQALHRQQMFSLLKAVEERDGVEIDGYEWRNSRVIFNDSITYENIDDLHIEDINDVFYYWHGIKGPHVQYINSNIKSGLQIPWPINDVWIEDRDLSGAPINLSCEDALQRLKEYNGVLPKNCNFITLRLPVGPKDCNPQWTFGGIFEILFIDAVTGEIHNCNPAFEK